MPLSVIEYPQRNVNDNPLFVSKWSAINHSMLFKMIRQDYQAVLNYDTLTNTMVFLAFGTVIDNPLPGDKIYIESPSNSDTFTLAGFILPNIFIMEPQTISGTFGASGFVNLESRKNYFIRTNVYGVNEGNQYEFYSRAMSGFETSRYDSLIDHNLDEIEVLHQFLNNLDLYQYEQ